MTRRIQNGHKISAEQTFGSSHQNLHRVAFFLKNADNFGWQFGQNNITLIKTIKKIYNGCPETLLFSFFETMPGRFCHREPGAQTSPKNRLQVKKGAAFHIYLIFLNLGKGEG